MNITSLLPEDVPPGTCDYSVLVNEDDIYTVVMSVNNIIGSSKKTTSNPFSKL